MARILLAEDEEVLRMLITDTLEDLGHQIDEASDGEEAYRLIQQHEYELIILDYMMPVYTGMELIKKIKKHPKQSEAKVMMLSAKSQAADQQSVLKAGADEFVSKPFSPLILLDKVEEILSSD
ncbi:response regulator [Metabacillus indicus]|uniref:response regulator transcription factor n=1 Tax=Metabacillus indicus TaxID=246786 RepID=UPI0029FF8773|nr:response regulator [Metabacillus indicus]MDX8290309.1 response regulator [Metabacillus indicus]